METTKSNVTQYFEEVNDLYDIDFEHFKRICLTPFIFVRNIISSGVLCNIRLQYFGVFEVSPSRVKYSKKTLEKNFKEGLIPEERYNRRITVLNNYNEDNT